jgi:hypothetical protein
MPPRPRSTPGAACLAAALVGATVAGCSGDTGVREPGAAVTEEEAATLARLLQRNYQRGGADFVVTAPYADDVVLTLTGEVDFRRSRGRAELVTSYGDARRDDTATVVFTSDQLWVGELPGLEAALADAGEDAGWVRRPLDSDGTADLVDVLARIVIGLGRARSDDPAGFRDGDWTWQGQRSIDSRLSTLFTGPDGPTVAVDAADDLLLQFATALPGQSFEVTVTLAGHGRQTVELPASGDTADRPDLADALGF